MFKLLSAAALSAVLAFGAVHPASAEGECETPSDLLTRLSSNGRDVSVYRDMSDDDAHAFMDAINALPPVTDFTAERVIIYNSPAVQTSYYIASFDAQGCRNHSGAMPAGIVERLIKTVEGASL